MTLSLQNLFDDMKEQRKKTKNDEDDDFVVVQQTNMEWPKIFDVYFLSTATRLTQASATVTSEDDLIFYVTRKIPDYLQQDGSKGLVEVFRHHDSKRQPKLGASDYDWEETTNLNLILHQFEYIVTTAVCIKPSNKHLQIIKRLSTTVYASPSRRDMRHKGVEERITYPNIYFTVDNFEDRFCEILLNEGQIVCVELVAKHPILNKAKVLFLGSIKYEALKKVYETRATTSTRMAQRMSLGMYTKRRVEFVRMRGPSGKGHAEMAISLNRNGQSDTSPPQSTLTTPTASNADDENYNQSITSDDSSASKLTSTKSAEEQSISDSVASEVESTDIRQEEIQDETGFLGRTLNQAMSWMRKSNSILNQSTSTQPLQTCLTYITLPCPTIVKDILESQPPPLLTV